MVSLATAGALTLGEYIAKLQALAAKHGTECRVMTSGGDYPEGASHPWYVTPERANGYTPAGTVVLD